MATTIPASTPTTHTNGNSQTASSTPNAQMSLTPTDFMHMMVTQLQNQDPLNPTSSADILSQMSQIGQLQSSTSLQSTLQNFGTQTALSSASAMIGKTVTGTDSNSNPLTGVVSSVQVAGGNVTLELNNGGVMPLGNVTNIAPGPTTSATTSASTVSG